MPRVSRRIAAKKGEGSDTDEHSEESPVFKLAEEFDGMQGLGALDSIKQAEYWKERAIEAINKNKILEEENSKLESDVYAWERRTKRIEKRAERLQSQVDDLTKIAGRRKAISTNIEVSPKELEEVERNPSSELKKLMKSSFRNKWSKKKLAGVNESLLEEASVGDETAAARKYINEFLESNSQKENTTPVNMVVERRSDRSVRSAPEKRVSAPVVTRRQQV
jgi:membrane-associated HD superfamily phosphohydrolase